MISRFFLLFVVIHLSQHSSYATTRDIVEVKSSADTSFYESSERIGLVRLRIKGWQACAKKKLFGSISKLAEDCDVLGNISGFDAHCEGLYKCSVGPFVDRAFVEVKRRAFSTSKEMAKKVAEARAVEVAQEQCEKSGKGKVLLTLYAYWETWRDYLNEWNAQFFGSFECST